MTNSMAEALYAIAAAIERHAQAVESVRDAILQASGGMPPPDAGAIEVEADSKQANDDVNVEDDQRTPADPAPEPA